MKLLLMTLATIVMIGNAGEAAAQNSSGDANLNSLLRPVPAAAASSSPPAAATSVATRSAAQAGAPAAVSTQAGNAAKVSIASASARPAHPSRAIEEIIVTAEKREENLRDVPIAISAFTGADLEARGINDPKSLPEVVPGLTYNQLVGYSIIFIRGVGSDAFEPTADASVATYIDNIYQPFGHGLAQSFVKLKRIEVLKGPQGTLFGRNATGGAINIITEEPSDSFQADLQGTYASFRHREAKGFITGPLLPHLAGSVSLLYSKEDPYYHLLSSSPIQSLKPNKSRGVDARLQWTPLDQVKVTLSYLLSLSDGTGSIINTVQDPKPLLGTPLGVPDLGPRQASVDYAPGLRVNDNLYYGEFEWSPQWLDVKLRLSRQVVHTDLQYDFDSSPTSIAYFHASNQLARITTGELQFTSVKGGLLPDWMDATGGLYYFKSFVGYAPVIFGLGPDLQLVSPNVIDPLLALIPAGLPIPTDGVQLTLYSTLATRSQSAYLQTTFHITDWLDLTLGGRYQHEKRGTIQTDTDLTTSAGPLDLLHFPLMSATRVSFSPKVTLSVKPWEGQLFYATFARASKSGTFNLPAIYTGTNFVQPEVVDSYEIGNKGTLLDGTFQYDLAAFINRVKNLQTQIVSLQSGGAQNLVNADKALIRGVELDLTWRILPDLLPGLIVKASGSYLDAEYNSFPDGSGFDPTTGLFFGKDALDLLPARNFSGHQIVRTPRYSFTFGPNYEAEVPGGEIDFGASYYYNSGYFFDTQNTSRQPTYRLIDAHISYLYKYPGAENAGVRISLFGKNLADATYFVNRFPIDFATNSFYAPPRTVGVTLSFDFKS